MVRNSIIYICCLANINKIPYADSVFAFIVKTSINAVNTRFRRNTRFITIKPITTKF